MSARLTQAMRAQSRRVEYTEADKQPVAWWLVALVMVLGLSFVAALVQ